MRVRIDLDLCQGHGACRMTAPHLFFAREEDGQAYVLSEEVKPEDEDITRLAAASCPEHAIILDDSPSAEAALPGAGG
jgi:ferredoxin